MRRVFGTRDAVMVLNWWITLELWTQILRVACTISAVCMVYILSFVLTGFVPEQVPCLPIGRKDRHEAIH